MPATPRIRHMRNRRLDRSTRTDKLMVWLAVQVARLGSTPAAVFNSLRVPGSAVEVEDTAAPPPPAA